MTKEISPKDTEKPQKILNIIKSYSSESGGTELSSLNQFNIDELFPPLPDSTRMLIGTGHDDFVASQIARAVEDADASLLNMNVTLIRDDENKHVIHLRINHRNPERVARSLERYGYNILRIEENGSNLDYKALNELKHYLSI